MHLFERVTVLLNKAHETVIKLVVEDFFRRFANFTYGLLALDEHDGSNLQAGVSVEKNGQKLFLVSVVGVVVGVDLQVDSRVSLQRTQQVDA